MAAAETHVGLEIVRGLLTAKLEGQLGLLRRSMPAKTAAAQEIGTRLDALARADNIDSALKLEAKAASAYWGAWREVPMRFARADERHIPDHWRVFGERQSPLSASPRKTVVPAGALLNYLCALAEFESRLALLAVGLDPGLGWAHRDAPYRDSAVLDLLEPLRPEIDGYLLGLLQSRTFSRREFAELPSGQVRLMPDMAKTLASSTLPLWERMAATWAYAIAKELAASSRREIRIPSPSTRGARGKGHGTMSRRTRKSGAKPPRVPSACRSCGVILSEPERVYCPECIPAFKAERTEKLVSAARSVLADMRAAERDPAQTIEAKAKRVVAYVKRKEDARAWLRENPGPHDRSLYRSEILPMLTEVTLPEMMRATGLTSSYCWRIKRGERIPHPMHWEALRSLGC